MARTKLADVRPPITNLSQAIKADYSAADMKLLLGLTEGQLKVWIRDGIITVDESKGSGVHRKFSLFNLIEAYTAKKLSSYMKTNSILLTLKQIIYAMKARSWGDYESLFFGTTFQEKGFDGEDIRFQLPQPLSFNVIIHPIEDDPDAKGAELATVYCFDDGPDARSLGTFVVVNMTSIAREVLMKIVTGGRRLSPKEWLSLSLNSNMMR